MDERNDGDVRTAQLTQLAGNYLTKLSDVFAAGNVIRKNDFRRLCLQLLFVKTRGELHQHSSSSIERRSPLNFYFRTCRKRCPLSATYGAGAILCMRRVTYLQRWPCFLLPIMRAGRRKSSWLRRSPWRRSAGN